MLKVIAIDTIVNGKSFPTIPLNDFPVTVEWIQRNRLTLQIDSQGIERFKQEFGETENA